MDAFEMISRLEEIGFAFRLAIDYEYGGEQTEETETLLAQLADDREAAIEYLLSQRFAPLPDSFALPIEWTLNDATKRYILDAAENILGSIERGHSPLFGLLWCFKALAFIRGGKSLYERLESAVHNAYDYDQTQYAADWRRYNELQNASPEDAPKLLPEYLEVTERLRKAGAKVDERVAACL